ncbi:MAG: UvrD-helicase domain-containing protein [Candidatus Omnitrophica bacterium]|nr:UvrD-helicase domain-containing protein [Candidatus Omnitrophota bacterium]
MKEYKIHAFTSTGAIDYREKLNPQQLKAVEGSVGPSLVLAGAGSGKTRVLIYRLAYLLEKGVRPQNVLLVTFTNKAAKEMIHRSELLLKSTLSGLWAGTFHHIGNIILRREGHFLGYSANFTIVDREDSKGLIEDCVEDLGFTKSEKLFPKKDIIANISSLCVNSQREVDEVIACSYSHIEEYTLPIKKVLARYAQKKKEANVMDFDDLLHNWLKVLEIEEVREKYSRIFEYILVDEYQDTNRLQFEILQKISSFHKNILVVGDDAQSIYSFRAAEINNVLDFPKIFEGAKIFKLETNYRSSPQILAMANEIITHNINQFPKKLVSIKKDNCMPTVVKTKDVYQQAKFVSQRILELVKEGVPLKEIAVLFRSHFQALELEIELLKRNIPYLMRGGVRFFEQAHIKDTMSYLKIMVNPQDELAFKRALCLHKGIGRSFAHKIWEKIVKENQKLQAIAQELPKRQAEGFKEFLAIMESLRQVASPQEAIKKILQNYKDYCYLSFDNADERIMDLEELAKMAIEYPTIKRFILELGSYEDFKGETRLSPNEKGDILVLSTIHQAKGLEWEAVLIIGFSDYEFPHARSLANSKDLEEERRLFYVAVTRCKNTLYITYPETKYTFKNGAIITRPSMFLHELSCDVYEELNVIEDWSDII